MSNIHELISNLSKTYEEAIIEHLNLMEDDQKEMVLKAGIIIAHTGDGLFFVPLSKSDVYTYVGMLEDIKRLLLAEY